MMQFCKILFALVLFGAGCLQSVAAQGQFGAQGAEGQPNRRQLWLVPSPDPALVAHAVLFRPAGNGPFPLALIAHASEEDALRRAQMPEPEYPALTAWLVTRGYAVLVPERPGHGANQLVCCYVPLCAHDYWTECRRAYQEGNYQCVAVCILCSGKYCRTFLLQIARCADVCVGYYRDFGIL